MQFKALALFAAALSAVQAAQNIPIVLQDVATETIAFNQTVANWWGGPLGLIPIIAKNEELLKTIKDGTGKTQASDPLTFDEALVVAQDTIDLSRDLKSTVDTLISQKPKFSIYLIVNPIIKDSLKKQKAATADLSAAIVDKVPDDLKDVANSLIGDINKQFDRGIAAF